jgi:hypothetical protein
MWPLGFLFDRFALSERTGRRARLIIARPVVLFAAAEDLLMTSATLDSQPLQLGMLIYPGMTQPPFDAGTPATAGPEITALVTGVLQASGESVDRMVETAKMLRRKRQIAN